MEKERETLIRVGAYRWNDLKEEYSTNTFNDIVGIARIINKKCPIEGKDILDILLEISEKAKRL